MLVTFNAIQICLCPEVSNLLSLSLPHCGANIHPSLLDVMIFSLLLPSSDLVAMSTQD